MATSRYLFCPSCSKRLSTGETLFQTLKRIAENRSQKCKHCEKDLNLHLDFKFGLGASHNECIVDAAFYPQSLEKWSDRGAKIAFYPFLVVLHRIGRSKAIWLPYWHLVEKPKAKRPLEKYGQWAPCMDLHLYESLHNQARKANLLR